MRDAAKPSLTMPEFSERLSAFSRWTAGVDRGLVVSASVVVIVVVVVLCYVGRRRRRQGEVSAILCPQPLYANIWSSAADLDAGSAAETWLQTVTEWAWSRRHVTWRHLVDCGVDAWMTALTEQASRQPVSGEAPASCTGFISFGGHSEDVVSAKEEIVRCYCLCLVRNRNRCRRQRF